MLQSVNINKMPIAEKIDLLNELGFHSDGKIVLKDGKKFLDKYTGEPIRINNMFIYPGSTIILDNNSFSIVSFFEDNSGNV